MAQKNKILIIGGFGFIGYHLTKYLLSIGMEVVVFGHRSEKTKEAFKLLESRYLNTLDTIDGEVCDDDLHHLVHSEENIVGVFHLASNKSTTQNKDSDDALMISDNYFNDIGVFEFCESVLRHREYKEDERKLKLVYVSTGEVYGGSFKRNEPLKEESECIVDVSKRNNLYPVSKVAGEMLLRFGGYSFDWNIARIQNPFGPYMDENTLIPKLIKSGIECEMNNGGVFDLEYGKDTRPFVYVEDVVMALGHMYGKAKGGETYNIAGKDICLDLMVSEFANKYSPKLTVNINRNKDGEHRRMDCDKAKRDNIWMQFIDFNKGMEKMYEFYYKKYMVEVSMKNLGIK